MKKFFLFILIVLVINCQENPEKNLQMSEEKLYRPAFHFTPKKSWMNDPNGMFYYNGTYHLYFQYYPDDNVWGPMHWGHATSKDMVNWEEQAIALYPDEMGYIFSGSAVVDHHNTSGFGQDGKTPIVAIFTHHNIEKEKAKQVDVETQSIAYSLDEGMTWTKYAGNPVIENPEIRDFRDPKVIWDNNTSQWIMALAAQNNVRFYASPNLKDWSYLSNFGFDKGHYGGVWECPDLFPLKVAGSDEIKWVLFVSINPGGPNHGSSTQYFVGDFDGTNFTLDENFAQALKEENDFWVDFGRDNYAGVTWQNAQRQNGNKLFIGWMSNWDYAQEVPTNTWRSAMTIAREIGLIKTTQGYRLTSIPVEEATQTLESLTLDSKELLGSMKLELALDTKKKVGYVLSNDLGEQLEFGFDPAKQQFYIDRTKAGKNDFSEKFARHLSFAARYNNKQNIKGTMILDKTSVELFWDDGLTVMTEVFFPNAPYNKISSF